MGTGKTIYRKFDGHPELELDPEFAMQLVEAVEGFLEKRGIQVANDEKDGDPDAAIIYGSDYAELVDGFASVLKGWVPAGADGGHGTDDGGAALEAKVKYLTDKIDELGAIKGGDWIDLRAAEDVHLEKGEYRLIPLGVAVRLPEGCEAHIVPRSSTFKNFGIIQANSMGIVDNSYSGDGDQWYFPAIAMRDTVVHANDRICQFRIEKNQPALRLAKVEALGGPDRGGFGSTGKA